ncbi:brachyurin-like [Schistocerca americana]|uniref:brachyurin-like n=1 Tax=Schistocerca americana TaxID=7009 RepID=UPI001F4F1CC8|nr:brachyurin-like [Schistocerca americana]
MYKFKRDRVTGRETNREIMILLESDVLGVPRRSLRMTGDERIINGVDAPDQYLYMAAVFADGATLCGGTFVSRSWILTAAQCVVGWVSADAHLTFTFKLEAPIQGFTIWEVWLGVTSLAGGDPGRITIVSDNATANPSYSGNNYDIAVINTIVVEAPESETAANGCASPSSSSLVADLAPADLPFRSDTPASLIGEVAVMTGWGATVAGGPTETTLKTANGSFAGECGAGYHVCIYTYNQVDVTTGDYGGPLTVAGVGVGSYKVVGVAIGTDLSGNRSVFTNVYQNLDWIASVTDLPIYD